MSTRYFVFNAISNSTFVGNQAVTGGAVYIVNSSPFVIVNASFANNTAQDDKSASIGGQGAVILRNTLLTTTQGDNCLTAGFTVNDGGNNVQYPTASCGVGIPVADPKIGPLADNGGLTQTMALLPGSPAIDAGNDTYCASVPVGGYDQRDFLRIVDGNGDGTAVCDIGAFELNASVATSIPSFTPSRTLTPSLTLTPHPSLTRSATSTPTRTVASSTPSKTRTQRPTASYTLTPSKTFTLTPSRTPSITLTPTLTLTNTLYPCTQAPIMRASIRRDGVQFSGNLTNNEGALSGDGRYFAFAADIPFVAEDTNSRSDIFVYDKLSCLLELASVGTGGVQGNGHALHPSITYDGRYVVFESDANNITPSDTNGKTDIFLFDRQTQQTTLISKGAGGIPANGNSRNSMIAGLGRYIVFETEGTNLIPSGYPGIYLYDLQTQGVIALAASGTYSPVISADGNVVTFRSPLALVPEDTNQQYDVYAWERTSGQFSLVSLANDGSLGSHYAYGSSVSDDGRYVTFISDNQLTGDATPLHDHIFLRDRWLGRTYHVSTTTQGIEYFGTMKISRQAISGDGRYVAFDTDYPIIPEDVNGRTDVYVKDMVTGYVYLVSRKLTGELANGNSNFAVISRDSQLVAFGSYANNLVTGDTNNDRDLFIANLLAVNPATPTPTLTFTASVTFTPSLTKTASLTPTISMTPTASLSATATLTPSTSNTPTSSATPTITPSPTATWTSSSTPTSTPTYAPVTLVITTLTDFYDGVCDSQCSLRDAVTAAQMGDKITFQAGLSGSLFFSQPIVLINKSFTLQGPGTSVITLDGNYLTHLFVVNDTSNIAIRSLTLAHGASRGGGAIYNSGFLTLYDTVFTDNVAHFGGSAVYNFGKLTVDDSIFKNNISTGVEDGGAILSHRSAQINNSLFENNRGAYGGAIHGGEITIQNSTFRNNHADIMGGALYNVNLTLIHSEVANNSAPAAGGIAIDGGYFQLLITDSTIRDNVGGGLYAYSVGLPSKTTITRSAFLNNDSYEIYTTNDLWMSNSTLYGPNGFVHKPTDTTSVKLTNVTISAVFQAIDGNSLSVVQASQSIFESRYANIPCAVGRMIDYGNNLQYPGTSCNSSIRSANPLLNPPANNGGSTFTMSLRSGSPALDAADNAVCAADPVNNVDQRGLARPIDGNGDGNAICDIGAFEADTIPITNTPSTTPSPTASPTVSRTPTVSVTPSVTATPTQMTRSTATPTTTPSRTPSGVSPQTIGIYRPSTNTFYLRNSNTTGYADFTVSLATLGMVSTDWPVVGDWNGDGIDTIGFYRSSTGLFVLSDSNVAPQANYVFALGIPGDTPIAGDWDGDGRDGVGVFRPSNGIIYLKNQLTTGFADFAMVMGVNGDVGLAGDWNNDGIDSPGVYRPSQAVFYLSNQVCNCSVFADYATTFGVVGDQPFNGDWNGDGRDGIGVYRDFNSVTYLRNDPSSNGFADVYLLYGSTNDKPLAGRWGLAGSGSAQPAPTFIPAR
ncbi:MAG: hypothetical protein KF716_05455 [Anaerolineae bacterium]|nr:hypothetical protein [Anaerolineae bacterium]